MNGPRLNFNQRPVKLCGCAEHLETSVKAAKANKTGEASRSARGA